MLLFGCTIKLFICPSFRFPSDLAARDIDDQFMWGPALLVSPVLRPVSNKLKTSCFRTGGFYISVFMFYYI